MEIIEKKQKWRKGAYQGYECELIKKDGRRFIQQLTLVGGLKT